MFRNLADYLAGLKHLGLYREPRVVDARKGMEIVLDGNAVVNFCSNDYLGLASHPRVIQAVKHGLDEYGFGSGASQMICGRYHAHRMLEERLAEITGRDDVILFSSGYLANLAAISALITSRADRVVMDRLCHGSLIDGALLSKGKILRYKHANTQSLESTLQAQDACGKLVVTDTVFSMDGDLAPLPEITKLCTQYDARLFIDDAHGFGVLGKHGYGATEHFSLDQKAVPLMMATFGKALGCQGAFIAGRKNVVDTVRQRARPYIYTTAFPPAVAAGVLEALRILEQEPERRHHLGELIEQFRAGVQRLGLPVNASETAIQPVIIGDTDNAVSLSHKLLEKGFYVAAIRPPTVPANTARLRVTLTAAHTFSQVDRLVDSLSTLVRQQKRL